jgi:hypothetical protein
MRALLEKNIFNFTPLIEIGIFLSYLLMLVPKIAHPMALQTVLGITPIVPICLVFALTILYSYTVNHYAPPKKIHFSILKIVFRIVHKPDVVIGLWFLYLLLLIVEKNTFANYVYSQTGLYLGNPYFLSAIFFVSACTSAVTERRKLLYAFPVVLMSVLYSLYVMYIDVFFWIRSEDSVVEWLQFLFLSIGAILLFKASWKIKNARLSRSPQFVIPLIGALLFSFIAFEEISWGQRIFSIESPDLFKEINHQDEITIHNLKPVFGYVYVGYLMVAAYGLIGRFFQPIVHKLLRFLSKTTMRLLFVPSQLYIYFLIPTLYYFDRVILSNNVTGDRLWEEPIELLLIVGIFLHVVAFYKSSELKKIS